MRESRERILAWRLKAAALRLWAWLDEEDPSPESHQRRRHDELRHALIGRSVPLHIRGTSTIFHLRDMSSSGAAGLSEVPLAVGDTIDIELGRGGWIAADVRWVRRAMAGIKFAKPVDIGAIEMPPTVVRGGRQRR